VETRASRSSDVCGTIDELKRVLEVEPKVAASHPDDLVALVDDALAMEARMEQRLAEYEAWRERIAALAADLQALGSPRSADALDDAAHLRDILRRERTLSDAERAEAFARAEGIRAVASELERTLYRYKELALQLEAAYRQIKGNRSWVLEAGGQEETVGETADLPGSPDLSRWLPPSPSRERIVRYVRVGRAHLVPAARDDEPPLVQFEDGGLMPLPSVRWSEDLRNFYAAEAPLGARGRLYRT
jgi:type II secretory pathway component PulJ